MTPTQHDAVASLVETYTEWGDEAAIDRALAALLAATPQPAWLDLRESQPEVGTWVWLCSISDGLRWLGKMPREWHEGVSGAWTHWQPCSPPPLPEAT